MISCFGYVLLSISIIGTSLAFSSSPMMTSSTTNTSPPASEYHLREYNPHNQNDRASLEEICANVYGGGDYLPQTAAKYVADPECSFLALTTKESTAAETTTTTEDDTILAVANFKRLPAQNSAWIEAVRTHPDHRNKGLASRLLRSLVDMSKEEDKHKQPRDILTCTVESNVGMQRALQKVGFEQCNTISTLSFAKLRDIPGWKPDDQSTPQPLLDALDLHHLVSSTAKAISPSQWTNIFTDELLLSYLEQFKLDGGTSGYLPGLYEYIVPGVNRADLKQSMEHGLVFVLDVPYDKELSSCDSDVNTKTNVQAILAFTQDERISSLKSKWVCSIVAYSELAFEAALNHAHSLDVARLLQSFGSSTREDLAITTSDAELQTPPFCLVFDDAFPIGEEALANALPLVTDPCVVFKYRCD